MNFVDLPDSLLLETLSYLDASELFPFVKGIPRCRKVAENKVFICQFLQRERLPGDSLDDLIHHMLLWEKYKESLRAGLHRIVFHLDVNNHFHNESNEELNGTHENSNDLNKIFSINRLSTSCTHEEQKDSVRSFLRDAIFNFTNRTAGAQPWYEQLPLGPGKCFEFALDLTANMRQVNTPSGRVWTELSEGDGTRILPTWLSTQEYRQEYGFFKFHHQGARDYNLEPEHESKLPSPYLVVHDADGNQYYVPGSCRPEPVFLTGVLHRAASGLNMYTRILQRTVESGCPEHALQILTSEMLPSSSWFRHLYFDKQQQLPKQAALEMHERAKQLLMHHQGVTQAVIWANANQVLLRQQRREWNSISLSLWKLCRNIYGHELTPPLHEMFEPMCSEDVPITRATSL